VSVSVGFTGDGTKTGTGCKDVNECTGTNDCVDSASGGACKNTEGGFTCSCQTGFAGDGTKTGTGCTDVDECAGANDCVAAASGGACTNTPGRYTCGCADGYTGDGKTNGTGCTDVDECAGANNCVVAASHGTCTNTVGSYTCGCESPYTGDGSTAGTGCRWLPDVLWYRFDGAGTSVPNKATTPPLGAETATLMGGNTQGSTGQCGGALIGTGNSSSNDYVQTGWPTNLTGSWTISFWTSNIPSSSILFYVFGDLSAQEFRCFMNGVAGPGNWILRGTMGTMNDVLVNGAATVEPSVTTFVYDSAVPEIRAYHNGTLVNTVAQPALSFTGLAFKLGYSSNVELPVGGLFDEFRVYSAALPASEVALLAQTESVCK
jgi:Concanavalin A-like lectin/glucanases superfamily/Calcium-binding EGF domain